MRLFLLTLLALVPTAALAVDANPQEYIQDRWRHSRDTATLGAVVGVLGVGTAGAGFALRDEEGVPAGFMIGTGALAAASGATVMSVVGLNQRYEFLDRRNSPVGAYLSLGLVGLSGIGIMGAVVSAPESDVHQSLLYGSAAIGATAIVPAALQLAGNGSRFNAKKTSVSWVPVVTKDHVGAVAALRF